MGHTRLGALPCTRRWDQVVGLIADGGDAAVVSAAALHAAEAGFQHAADDPGVERVTWLLTQLPLAAREPNYVDSLRSLGLTLDTAPTSLDLIAAFTDAVDGHLERTSRRTVFGEMAQLAAVEALGEELSRRTGQLFGTAATEVQQTLAGLATTVRFGSLARTFFAAVIRRYLTFFLSRELPNHVGGLRRFANMADHAAFTEALALHSRQASEIIEQFAGEWFSKTNYEGGITPPDARGFAWVALKKIRAELRARAEEAA